MGRRGSLGAGLGRTSLRVPSRALLTISCLALGIALFTCVERIRTATFDAFKRAQDTVVGKADLVVTAGETGIPETAMRVIGPTPGVLFSLPRVALRAFNADSQDKSETLSLFGVDLFRERFVRTTTARPWTTAGNLSDLKSPDAIAVAPLLAEKRGLAVGSSLRLATAYGIRTFKVRAILDSTGPLSVFGGSAVVMSLPASQAHFGREGRLDRIEVLLKKEANVEQMRSILAAKLGPGTQVEVSERRAEGFARLGDSLQTALRLFGLVALSVALLVAGGSLDFHVALRRREIALRRALGASRRQVVVSIVSEAVGMGLVGTVLGIGLGRLLATNLAGLVEKMWLGQFRVALEIHPKDVGSAEVPLALLVGLGATFVSALPAAWRAASVAPAEGWRPARPSSSREPSVLPWFLVGYAALSLSFGWFAVHPVLAVLEALSAIGAVALFAPRFVRAVCGQLAKIPIGARFGLLTLALRNLSRASGRTAGASRILALSLGFGVVLAVLNASLEASIERALSYTLQGDLVVSGRGKILGNWSQPLHQSVGAKLREVPGIRNASATRYVPWSYTGASVGIKAFDKPAVGETLFAVREPSYEEAASSLFERTSVLISESFRRKFRLGQGDSLTLETPSGPATFPIAGIVDDYAHSGGVIYLNRDHYRALWKDELVSHFRVELAPGVSAENIRSGLGGELGLEAMMPGELREQVRDSVRQSFAFAKALEAVAILIALLGAASAVTLALLDRSSELSAMRAVGMSKGQLHRLLTLELGILGALTAVCAAGIGLLVGAGWALVTLGEVLGWTVRLSVPADRIGFAVALGAAAMIAAGWIPLKKHGRRLSPAPVS